MTVHERGGDRPASPSNSFEGIVHVNYDTVDLPEWFVEPGEERGYRPWQHTPLTPYDEQVRPHQMALYNAFQRLATEPIPPDIDVSVAHLVHLDFMAGNARRQSECQANFVHWKDNHPDEYAAIEANAELAWLLGEAKMGHANPASLLRLLAAAPSLRSLDLQVLTTPFGYRRHNLPAMRAELAETVEGIGGEIFETPIETHAPKIAAHVLVDENDKDNGQRGVIVTQKRLIGRYTPEDQPANPIFLMERQAYVVRTDEASGFSSQIIKHIRKVPSDSPEFAEVQKYILDRITNQAAVIPTSTMVYAFHLHEQAKRETSPTVDEARRTLALGQTATR